MLYKHYKQFISDICQAYHSAKTGDGGGGAYSFLNVYFLKLYFGVFSFSCINNLENNKNSNFLTPNIL